MEFFALLEEVVTLVSRVSERADTGLKPTRVGTEYSGKRGTFADVSHNSISPDPMGTKIVYVYEGNGVAIASTSIQAMITSMRTENVLVEVDEGALGTTVAMGNLQTSRLPVKGASLLPVQTTIRLEGGRAIIESTRDGSVDLLSDEALRARAVDEILQNLESIAKLEDRIIVEMTGGLDSRVTLAAALHLGFRDRIDFATRGRSSEPDRMVAERVAHAFDIDFVTIPYLEQEVTEAEFQANGEAWAGVRWLDDVAFRMKEPRDGFVVLTGGMGELFRNYYCEAQYYKYDKPTDYFEQPMTEEVARGVFRIFGSRRRFLMNPSLAEDAFVEELCRDPGTIGHRLFLQYNHFRNRIHYGVATTARNRYFRSADPLYTVSGHELAKRKSTEWQLFGELSFEIIDELFPALNIFPLAEKELPPRFAAASKEHRFLTGREPLSGMKERAPINSIDRFGFARPRANDVGSEYVTPRFDERASGFLKYDLVKSEMESAERMRAHMVKKMIASPVMLMSMINK